MAIKIVVCYEKYIEVIKICIRLAQHLQTQTQNVFIQPILHIT